MQNTKKINAFFSEQKSSETSESESDEENESKPSSSNMVIAFIEQSESRPLAKKKF